MPRIILYNVADSEYRCPGLRTSAAHGSLPCPCWKCLLGPQSGLSLERRWPAPSWLLQGMLTPGRTVILPCHHL